MCFRMQSIFPDDPLVHKGVPLVGPLFSLYNYMLQNIGTYIAAWFLVAISIDTRQRQVAEVNLYILLHFSECD